MMEPMYQEFRDKYVIQFNDDGLKVRVINGGSYGVDGVVQPNSICMYLDVWVNPGKDFRQKVPAGWQGLLFMYRGDQVGVSCGERKWTAELEQSNIFEMKAGSEEILVKNVGSKEARFIFIAWKPLREPVKQHRPFVMCTDAEIEQDFEDYQNQKNGF
jgi:redox-sensitive bicupin YhaK (pirin superfamily)